MERFDAVVVGAGAAGSWAAKELCERGLEVCLVDAGGLASQSGSGSRLGAKARALLGGQRVQAWSGAFDASTRRLFVDDRRNPYTTERGAPFNWFRGRQVGGRLHLWLRVCPRLAGDDLRDWPFGPAELAEHYDAVERFLAVEPAPLTPEEERFATAVSASGRGWTVTPSPNAAADPGPLPRAVAAAQATGRLTLRPGLVVRRVEVDGDGLATGISAIDVETRAPVEVRARTVVLAASTIETVRLLLLSTSPAHPAGLGNSSGLLGRGLSDQLLVAVGGPDAPGARPGGDEVGLRVAPGDRPFAVQGAIGRSGWWSLAAEGRMDPQLDNRVTLDPRRRDEWGIPAARIRCVHSAADRELAAEQAETLRDLAGIGGLEISSARSALDALVLRLAGRRLQAADGLFVPGSAAHETGGAPLGTVLDPAGRCRDAPNVLVVDGAAFPSGGSQNVTLTIMALARRACERLAREIAPR